jgi:hypothetical protein
MIMALSAEGPPNRISMQSTVTQEEECAEGNQKSMSFKPHPLDHTPSLGRQSYRAKQLPQHLQPAGSHQKSNLTLYSLHGKDSGSSTSFL